MRNDELIHYGVLGMKWGVRKNKPKASGSKKRKRKAKLSDVTTKDLSRKVNRLKLEQDYKRMSNPTKHRAKLIGAAALTAVATGAVSTVVRRYTGKGLDVVEAMSKGGSKNANFLWDLPISELKKGF